MLHAPTLLRNTWAYIISLHKVTSQSRCGAPTLKVAKFGGTYSVYESYGLDQII